MNSYLIPPLSFILVFEKTLVKKRKKHFKQKACYTAMREPDGQSAYHQTLIMDF